jgi:hypothetical protein
LGYLRKVRYGYKWVKFRGKKKRQPIWRTTRLRLIVVGLVNKGNHASYKFVICNVIITHAQYFCHIFCLYIYIYIFFFFSFLFFLLIKYIYIYIYIYIYFSMQIYMMTSYTCHHMTHTYIVFNRTCLHGYKLIHGASKSPINSMTLEPFPTLSLMD